MSSKAGPRLWTDYWRAAWRDKPPAKLYSPVRAIPSILISGAQLFLRVRGRPSANDMWIAIGIIIVVYLVLYALESVWNLAVVYPVNLDSQHKTSIADLKTKSETLQAENSKLKQPQISHLLQTQLATVKNHLENCNSQTRPNVEGLMGFLLVHGQMKWVEIRGHFAPGVPDKAIESWLEEAKRVHLLEKDYNAVEQQWAWSVRAALRDAMELYLHQKSENAKPK